MPTESWAFVRIGPAADGFSDSLARTEPPRSARFPRMLLVASDHAGFELKEKLKTTLGRLGVAYSDLGTHSTDSVDYPDFARARGRGA